MDEERIDRRQTGVHKVVMSNGNGGKEETYAVSVQKMRAWVGLVAAVIAVVVTVVGGVAAGVKFGVHTEVQDQIEVECLPGGMIQREIQHTAEEYIEEVQGVIQDDLDFMDRRMKKVEDTGIRLEAGQVGIAAQQTRNQEELRMLLQDAISE